MKAGDIVRYKGAQSTLIGYILKFDWKEGMYLGTNEIKITVRWSDGSIHVYEHSSLGHDLKYIEVINESR